MEDKLIELLGPRPATFGRRKVTPRACVAEGKKHLREFLGDILADLGFVTVECGRVEDLHGVLETHLPDLVLLGIAVDGIEPGRVLQTLVRAQFGSM